MNPAEADRFAAHVRRQYVIAVTHDRRRFVWRPYSATLTHGLFHVGYPTDLIWHARTREKVVAKVERKIRRMALRDGITDPDISVRNR